MPIITALEPQKRNLERVNVHLDGSFAFGVAALVLATRRLTVGSQLQPEDIEALRRDDDVEKAYSACLNFLSFRPRSRREIHDYLRRKGTDPEVSAAAIERLESNGLIDERAFVDYWIENRQTFKPRGTRALRAELRQKGVEWDLVDEALEGITNEEEMAHVAGQKKLHSLRGLDDQEFFRKMLAFLQRRGFGYEAAGPAARRLLEERRDNP
jgi:regulatory protein